MKKSYNNRHEHNLPEEYCDQVWANPETFFEQEHIKIFRPLIRPLFSELTLKSIDHERKISGILVIGSYLVKMTISVSLAKDEDYITDHNIVFISILNDLLGNIWQSIGFQRIEISESDYYTIKEYTIKIEFTAKQQIYNSKKK